MVETALHNHLVRLLVAAGISVVGGLLLVWRYPGTKAFGTMSAAWGLIDAIIALVGLRNVAYESLEALRATLAFNLGLNFGYIGVGVAMAALAGDRKTVRGFGQAIVVQGLILLWLDGMLWVGLPTPQMME